MTSDRTTDAVESVAIIGMSGRFPGANNTREFWENLRNGVESIQFFDESELRAAGVDAAIAADPNFVPAGGVLDSIDRFDAEFFGYSARDAEIMDPQQRLFIECSWEAPQTARRYAAASEVRSRFQCPIS
jgi:acyl transferase domain-containing protein